MIEVEWLTSAHKNSIHPCNCLKFQWFREHFSPLDLLGFQWWWWWPEYQRAAWHWRWCQWGGWGSQSPQIWSRSEGDTDPKTKIIDQRWWTWWWSRWAVEVLITSLATATSPKIETISVRMPPTINTKGTIKKSKVITCRICFSSIHLSSKDFIKQHVGKTVSPMEWFQK